ncbi:hypothetical protein D3C75_1055230 [compost metagenome]
MQHRATGVFALQFVLQLKGFEGVVGKARRQLRGVGVVRRLAAAGLKNVGVTLKVFLGKAVGGALGRGRFEVVEMAGFFLETHQGGAHMVQQLQGKRTSLFSVHALLVTAEVAQHFMQAIEADGGKMIAQGPQVPFGVRI